MGTRAGYPPAMRRHSFVVTFAASALVLGACNKTSPVYNPPPPEPPIGNPPAPEPEPTPDVVPASTLPTWDDVASGHPEGATNPPIPHLVVKPDGSCFKQWVSPMLRLPSGKMGDYVDTECGGEDCGTAIQCPERAATVLEEWKKAQEGTPE